ncbi:MAG: hypothetical protein Q9213_004877 [Squamulea squamosa]
MVYDIVALEASRRVPFGLGRELAAIDPATPHRPSSSSHAPSPFGTPPIARSKTPSAHRRSVITDQIYQFALGYPQTPPENSPLEATGDLLWKEPKVGTGAMGSFVFRWDHPAGEVYVTGTFDDWAKSVKLDKEGGGFAKRVKLPLGQKISYKFVVDGTWCTSTEEPEETDQGGNVNNILTPDRISSSADNMSSVFTSGVTPESTTAKLAGEVPKESSRESPNAATGPQTAPSSDVPGTFPETPANEASDFSVNPIPASSGYGNPINLQPGEKVPDPSTFNSNTVSSTVKDDPSLAKSDESEKTFGVAPLPATGGFGNPINLEPGEKVPHPSEYTSNTIDTHVTTDKESYEKGSNAPQLPDVITPQQERDSKGASMFSVPGISRNMIPESSLPMGEGMPAEKDPGAFIQSAGAGSTTAALAGNVPKEATGGPPIVQKSHDSAGVDAEAGHNQQAVIEKSNVEKELESKVPEAAGTSEGIAAGDTSSKGKAGEINHGSHALPASIQQSIDEMNRGSAIAPTVPDVVQNSIAQAHVSPEAAGEKSMVGEKTAMESELLKKVSTENASGEPAPVASAALTESAPAPTDSQTMDPAAVSSPNPATASATDNLSSAAAPSDEASTTAPPSTETAAVPTGSSTNSTVSSTMKGAKSFPAKSTAPPPAISEPATTPSDSMTTAAAPASTPATETAARKSSDYSRGVSPMTKTEHQSQPMVTTGVGSSTAPQTSQSTPSKAAAPPSSSSPPRASTDKKSKRASGFFGKLKAKFSDKK